MTPIPPAPLLETRGLSKRFGPVDVLREVDLRVERGEVVALLGENGAGKSILVACLARILDPDGGSMLLEGRPWPDTVEQVRTAGVEVVWQDHGLCEDLDVVANVFLGREPGRFLGENRLRDGALASLRRVGADRLPQDRPVRMLSRGQRQLVAMSRAMVAGPRLLLLDEPTASLGLAEARRIQIVIRQSRDAGTGILLVTHDLEQVFGLADRVVVLREGRVVADTPTQLIDRDDLVALMSGIEMDSMARRQLHRLRSLVDQLSDVDPPASLPIIVSAMTTALDQEILCFHLLEESDGEPRLRRTAAVGLPDAMLEVNARLPIGPDGGCAGLAAAGAETVVVPDLSARQEPGPYGLAAARSGIRSEWAAPIVGTRGVLGTVTGLARSIGRPEPAQLELARLYLGYAASAIERERLLSEVSRRNRVLESLRAMLETLAGPDRLDGGLGASLLALSGALGADVVGVFIERHGVLELHAANDLEAGDGGDEGGTWGAMAAAAGRALDSGTNGRARLVEPDVAAVELRSPEGRAVLVARLASDADGSIGDTLELLDDATRSLGLAIEGEILERTRREAAALRRSQAIQRELLSSLSHELRTPLTAIQGYASTLRQPDLTWDEASTERFLESIATEAARLERLVGDLLDSSAIESGILRLQRGLVRSAARPRGRGGPGRRRKSRPAPHRRRRRTHLGRP